MDVVVNGWSKEWEEAGWTLDNYVPIPSIKLTGGWALKIEYEGYNINEDYIRTEGLIMSNVMPAGEYYIGDCCYVLREDQHKEFDWVGDFCEPFFASDDEKFKVLGEYVLAMSTKHGDGVYSDGKGNEYPVDAGLIGAVPVSLWKGDKPPFGCYLVKFTKDFICGDDRGLLWFGDLAIETDPEEDYDY